MIEHDSYRRAVIERSSVGLMVENDALCFGLEQMLRQVPWVGEVVRSEWLAPSADVTIVDQQWWTTAAPEKIAGAPRVLVLLESESVEVDDLPVDGFVSLSGISTHSLVQALEQVMSGGFPMPTELARRLISGETRRSFGRVKKLVLTDREMETLSLLASGLSNKQIARRLQISPHGVKRLVSAVLLKLDAPNRTTAVVTAMKSGLV